MASTDTTNDAVIERTVSDPNFQARCYRRFLAAAISDMNETVQATTSAQSASGATSLTFASQPAGIAVGWSVQSLTNPAAIPATALVKTVGAAVTISAATTVIVASGDIILFSPPSHVARAQLAGALFNGVLSLRTLAMLILANATNQANCLADASVAGGAILDSDIDFQINSIFTGIATSHGW
jgi:uncharacterized membrane protein YgcG